MPEPTNESKTEPKSFRDQHADLMRQKVAAGLTPEQAEAVIKEQIAWDAKLAAEAEAAKKKKA